MIIGIDANTKTKETKTDVVRTVLDNKGYFGYFQGDNIVNDIIEREKIEKTSMGKRTFGLQSQFGKAGEGIENYVDFFILANKEEQKRFKILKTYDNQNNILTNTNPSDHAPRKIVVEIGDKYDNKGDYTKIRLCTFNVAGPNSNMLEYSL